MSNEIAQLHELLHAWLLVEIMGDAISKAFKLKGGVAIWAEEVGVHTSEDAGQHPGLRAKARAYTIVRRWIEGVPSGSLIEHARVEHPRASDATLRWEIDGLQPGSGAPIHLKVDVSPGARMAFDDGVKHPLLDRYGHSTGLELHVLDSRAITLAKVFFSPVPVLIEARIDNPLDPLARAPDAKTRVPPAMAEVWSQIVCLYRYQDFESKVVPFLSPSFATRFGRAAFEVIQMRFGEQVDG